MEQCLQTRRRDNKADLLAKCIYAQRQCIKIVINIDSNSDDTEAEESSESDDDTEEVVTLNYIEKDIYIV